MSAVLNMSIYRFFIFLFFIFNVKSNDEEMDSLLQGLDKDKLKKLAIFFNSKEKLKKFKDHVQTMESSEDSLSESNEIEKDVRQTDKDDLLADFSDDVSKEMESVYTDINGDEFEFENIEPVLEESEEIEMSPFTDEQEAIEEDLNSLETPDMDFFSEDEMIQEASPKFENEENQENQEEPTILEEIVEKFVKEDEDRKANQGKLLEINYEFKTNRLPIRYPTQNNQNSLTIWGRIRNLIDIDLINNTSVGFQHSMDAQKTIDQILAKNSEKGLSNSNLV